MGFESDSCGLSGLFLMRSLCWAAQDNILIQSRSLLKFLFCLGRESRQIIFLLISSRFNNLPLQDDKGDVSAETTGPAWAVAWADDQTSAERLAVLLLISKSSN
ncbi:hypothetical protein V6N13_135874 [Hibiscus sabdariffa]|uniref:Uncharacterized protein n=1 Tax=Hibiscus sabdariffa TaxID=183260 RepID=A0ABR2QTH4_9ROSI